MLDQAFEKLSSLQWGEKLDAVNEIDQAIVDSHGNADARKDLEERLIAVIKGNGTRNGKETACRKLRLVGTSAAVPALAELLGNAELSHMARYALESMPCEEAGNALRHAVGSVAGKLKQGVIGSLGVRAEDSSVSLLAGLLSDSDTHVAKSAAVALGAIRSSAAAKALSAATTTGEVALAVADASLACAEKLLAGGSKLEASAIYRKLSKIDEPKHVNLAAKRGLLACAAN
ncbi:MAG: HEAT repeat domain-containing protein [Planctomycetales bacterium]|nr:HEAT repeat domain-containing protein [Planctomycetales bacterium]